MHQLMTINAIFIYCLIPVFSGFSQVCNENILGKKEKILNNFLIILRSVQLFIII